MFANMNTYVAVTVILFIGASGQSPQEICASPLKRALDTNNPESCAEFEDYLKCVLRETNLHVLGTKRHYIHWMQQYVDSAMRTSLPFKCDVDIFELVRKVRVEDLEDAVAQNASHLYDMHGVIEFDDASNLAECANAYIYHVTKSGAITCEDFTEYTKCVVRTLVVFQIFDITNQTIAELDEDLYYTSDLLGLDNCVIDSLPIWNKFIKLYDPSVFDRDKTPLGGRSGYKACLVASCQTPEAACAGALGKALTRLGFDFCDQLQSYIVCFLDESNLQVLGMSHRRLREMKEDFESSMNSFPFYQCNFDVDWLARKMRAIDVEDVAGYNISDFLYYQGVTDYDDASNLGQCANAFHYHVTNAGAVTCEETTEYVKCIVRESVEFYTSGISAKQIDELEQDLNAMLEDLGLNECVIDSLQIWEHFLAMHNRSVSSPDGDTICLSACLFAWLLLVYSYLSCE